MCLKDLRNGEEAIVEEIPDGAVRHQLLRFGVAPGAKIRCHVKLPFGPVVVRHGGQEIAVGKALASKLRVRRSN